MFLKRMASRQFITKINLIQLWQDLKKNLYWGKDHNRNSTKTYNDFQTQTYTYKDTNKNYFKY